MRSRKKGLGAQSLAVDFLQPGKQYCGRDRRNDAQLEEAKIRVQKVAENIAGQFAAKQATSASLPYRNLCPAMTTFSPSKKSPRANLTSSAGSS